MDAVLSRPSLNPTLMTPCCSRIASHSYTASCSPWYPKTDTARACSLQTMVQGAVEAQKEETECLVEAARRESDEVVEALRLEVQTLQRERDELREAAAEESTSRSSSTGSRRPPLGAISSFRGSTNPSSRPGSASKQRPQSAKKGKKPEWNCLAFKGDIARIHVSQRSKMLDLARASTNFGVA